MVWHCEAAINELPSSPNGYLPFVCVSSFSILILGCESLDAGDTGFHFDPGRGIGGMHPDVGRIESSGGDGFFNPEDDVVASAVFVIAQVMVETEIGDVACLQQVDDLFRPTGERPAGGRRTFVIEEYLHVTVNCNCGR